MTQTERGGGGSPPPHALARDGQASLFVNGRIVGSIDRAGLADVADALEADDPYGVARRLRPVRAELRLGELDAVLLRVSIGRIAGGSAAGRALLDVLPASVTRPEHVAPTPFA